MFRLTHPVDPERFEKRVSLELFEQLTDTMEESRGKVPFTVVYDKLRLNAYIHSSQLDVPNKTGRLAIRVDSGLRAARGGNETSNRIETSMRVPGLYSLGVQRMGLEIARDERDEPSQALILEMNHSVIERDMPAAVHAWLLPRAAPGSEGAGALRQKRNRAVPVVPDHRYAGRSRGRTDSETHAGSGRTEHYELHSFRHAAEPGRFVYIKVDKGLKSFGGYVLGQSVENILRVPAYPQELRIAQQGSLLALSGDKTLTVMTRDVPAMRVQVGRLLPRQIQHLVSQTQGTFSAPSFRTGSSTRRTSRSSSRMSSGCRRASPAPRTTSRSRWRNTCPKTLATAAASSSCACSPGMSSAISPSRAAPT